MSELKATPGPWKTNRDGYVYSVATGERVCSPHSTLHDNEKMSEHIKDLKANAHLIAAAPELYSFVEEYLEAWENGMAGDSYLFYLARAVRGKARGRGME
jgi:hypothetical protein